MIWHHWDIDPVCSVVQSVQSKVALGRISRNENGSHTHNHYPVFYYGVSNSGAPGCVLGFHWAEVDKIRFEELLDLQKIKTEDEVPQRLLLHKEVCCFVVGQVIVFNAITENDIYDITCWLMRFHHKWWWENETAVRSPMALCMCLETGLLSRWACLEKKGKICFTDVVMNVSKESWTWDHGRPSVGLLHSPSTCQWCRGKKKQNHTTEAPSFSCRSINGETEANTAVCVLWERLGRNSFFFAIVFQHVFYSVPTK